ncbi:MAG: CmcI family methyltransferase [Roseiflexaceae bacterium]|nr:CmcI family methyltransferase [Roseiflexaceae bacterium]
MKVILARLLIRVLAAIGQHFSSVRRVMISEWVLWRNHICVTPDDASGTTREIYRRRFALSLRQWLLYYQHRVIFSRSTWMGVKMIKNPLDAWIYQELLYEVQPDIVIEIGSASGGSTLFLAHLLDIIGKGQVISIDIDRSNYHVQHPRIIEITGDLSSPHVVNQVAKLCRDKTVMVIHDGDHRKEQVLKDLSLYSPLVSVGSYFVVEDGIVDLFRPHEMMWEKCSGPLAAVEEFVRINPHFSIDLEREKYLITYNPRGYLRRCK